MLEQFERTELLIGKENVEKLNKSSVAIFGIGDYVYDYLFIFVTGHNFLSHGFYFSFWVVL